MTHHSGYNRVDWTFCHNDLSERLNKIKIYYYIHYIHIIDIRRCKDSTTPTIKENLTGHLLQ